MAAHHPVPESEAITASGLFRKSSRHFLSGSAYTTYPLGNAPGSFE